MLESSQSNYLNEKEDDVAEEEDEDEVLHSQPAKTADGICCMPFEETINNHHTIRFNIGNVQNNSLGLKNNITSFQSRDKSTKDAEQSSSMN